MLEFTVTEKAAVQGDKLDIEYTVVDGPFRKMKLTLQGIERVADGREALESQIREQLQDDYSIYIGSVDWDIRFKPWERQTRRPRQTKDGNGADASVSAKRGRPKTDKKKAVDEGADSNTVAGSQAGSAA